MIKKLLFRGCCCLVGLTGYGQEKKARNAFYLEGGGNAAVYSVNYDRIITRGDKLNLAMRMGLSLIPKKIYSVSNFINKEPGRYLLPVLPLELTLLAGRSPHKLETGLGLSPYLQFDDEEGYGEYYGFDDFMQQSKWRSAAFGRVGYRYQKSEGGIVLRAGFTPSFYRSPVFGFFPYGGLSIGWGF